MIFCISYIYKLIRIYVYQHTLIEQSVKLLYGTLIKQPSPMSNSTHVLIEVIAMYQMWHFHMHMSP